MDSNRMLLDRDPARGIFETGRVRSWTWMVGTREFKALGDRVWEMKVCREVGMVF